MVTCPYCHGQNEDGALFCEQCKSDLTGVASSGGAEIPPALEIPAAMEAPLEIPQAMEAVPLAEALEIPAVEAFPVEAIPLEEAIPVQAPPLEEAIPVAAEIAPVVVPNQPPPPPPPSASPTQGDDPYLIPATGNPRLLVVRGQKPKVEYTIMEGINFMGRADEKPVDIDLEEQENPERVWCSRQHAVIELENGKMTIEDLNSSNGTFLNRNRIYPGQKQPLKPNDVIQIGSIQMKLLV